MNPWRPRPIPMLAPPIATSLPEMTTAEMTEPTTLVPAPAAPCWPGLRIVLIIFAGGLSIYGF
jgi:hypothetical protein